MDGLGMGNRDCEGLQRFKEGKGEHIGGRNEHTIFQWH